MIISLRGYLLIQKSELNQQKVFINLKHYNNLISLFNLIKKLLDQSILYLKLRMLHLFD